MKISNPKNIDKTKVKNIIFDWGGVITELDFNTTNKMFEQLGIKNFIQQFSKHNLSGLLHKLEVGLITREQAFNELKERMNPGTTDKQIIEAWMSVLSYTPKERINLLQSLKDRYHLFLLSNTNEIHADNFNRQMKADYGFNYFDIFEEVFYSHVLHLRKPGNDIFTHVLKTAAIRPEETLFIDDTEANIDTADSLGIISLHLNGNQDIVELFKDWQYSSSK